MKNIACGIGLAAALAVTTATGGEVTNFPTIYADLYTFHNLPTTRPIRLRPQFNPVTDGTNLYWGETMLVYPTNGTVVISNLVPNQYVVTMDGVAGSWILPVPFTNGYLNMTDLGSNLLTWRYWLSGVDALLNGSNTFKSVNTFAKKIVASGGIYDMANVKYWGAMGDGVSDDTAAIQAGYNALTNGTRGGELILPAGVFPISQLIFGNVVPPSGSTNGFIIRGQGRNATTLLITGNNAIGINFIGQFNSILRDLTIDTAPGVIGQTAMFVARDANAYSCNWVRAKGVRFAGHYNKANVVHLAAELSDYDDCVFECGSAVPGLYTASSNEDIGITNNWGTFWANSTTANSIRNCTFMAYVPGSCGFRAYGSVGWTLKNNWFGSDQATNALIYLKCSTNTGFMSFGGTVICRDNIYEGINARPYYFDNNHPTWMGQYYNLSDSGGTFNVWASNTNQMLTCKYPNVSLFNCDLAPRFLFNGCNERLTYLGHSTLTFPRGNILMGALMYPTTVNITYGMDLSSVQADSVTVGPTMVYPSEVHTPTSNNWYGLATFNGLNTPALAVNTNALVVSNSLVSVGSLLTVGKTNSGLLTIRSSWGWGAINPMLSLDARSGSVGGGQSIDFWDSIDYAANPLARIAVGADASGNNLGDVIVLNGLNGAAPAERLRVKYNGNVGIGTNAPGFLLDVAGNANASGYYLGGTNLLGITYNIHVITNGTQTAYLHFTNGILTAITAP